MNKESYTHPTDQPDGDYACDLKRGDTRLETQVRTVIAGDGVEETQVTYVPFGRGMRVNGFGNNYNLIDWNK